MEERMKKYRQLSPERAKVWTEKPPKYHQHQQQNDGKVPVVYYLCTNRQLQHPHFMEVPLSSPDGLYLRDVIERFNVLRGRGMASSYSWSCKRSYKNRFVWHDLCEDDIILPVHGNEYVLKGSELCEESNSGYFNHTEKDRLSNSKVSPEPPSSRSQDDSCSLPSTNLRHTKNPCDGEPALPAEHPDSSNVSPRSSSLSLKINKTAGLADSSIQMQENISRAFTPQDTCKRGVSIDNRSPELEKDEMHQARASKANESAEICRESATPPPSLTNASSGGRTDTLLSLIRADISKLSRFKKSDEYEIPWTKLKPSNMLMQLIPCGSISVKDHRFGLLHNYKPRFSHSKCPCPLFSSSLSLGKLDCLTNQRLTGLRLEDEDYFCGSWMEPTIPKEGVSALTPSSLQNTERTNKQLRDSVEDKEGLSSTCSECVRHSTKASLNNLPKMESIGSPLSEGPRISSERVDSSRTGTSSVKKHFKRMDSSYRNEKESVIKIAETLDSGAQIIVHSKGIIVDQGSISNAR